MQRLVLVVVALSVISGCTTRADRASLAHEIDGIAAEARRTMASRSAPPIDVPLAKRWRFAGTKGDEHILVHVPGDGNRRRIAVPQRDFVMPAAMPYTDDDRRWVPLKLNRRIRADGTVGIDFTRLSANEIDASHTGAAAHDLLKVGL
ncbi:MAG TPA: hypothetical protein VEL07_13930 [Planctomycetota bacterium]|nr:hypothetical protein [Planctomycetota bacterium]